MGNTGKRYTDEKIIAILKEADAHEAPVGEVLRHHGISPQTYYRWKAKFAGLEIAEVRRLKTLEEENARLKRIIADQTLNLHILKGLTGRSLTTAAARRAAVDDVRSHHAGVSDRRCCRFLGVRRSSQRYRSRQPSQATLRARRRQLAEERARWGYRRLARGDEDEPQADLPPLSRRVPLQRSLVEDPSRKRDAESRRTGGTATRSASKSPRRKNARGVLAGARNATHPAGTADLSWTKVGEHVSPSPMGGVSGDPVSIPKASLPHPTVSVGASTVPQGPGLRAT